MGRNWGKQFLFDGYECNHVNIRSKLTITDFVLELVQAIDMVAYGSPQVVHFGSGDKAGFTLVQLIETSNIVCHFIEETNAMCLDVFSCKDFDPEVVIDVIEKYFSPKYFNTEIIYRGEKNGASSEEPAPQGPSESRLEKET